MRLSMSAFDRSLAASEPRPITATHGNSEREAVVAEEEKEKKEEKEEGEGGKV